MRRALSRFIRVAFGAVAMAATLVAPGCGSGGGGGGPFATVTFENDVASSHVITQVDFDYFDISLLPDLIDSVLVTPGENVTYDFDSFQAQNLFEVTLTWSDTTTTVIPLVPFVSSGGNFSYPVVH